MATMIEATEFENEILRHRNAQGEHLDFQCVHRIAIRTDGDKVRVFHVTNDNDDDGFPDGVWAEFDFPFPNVEMAKANAGKCRVGISGVIVTVTLDGEEIR